MRLPSAHHLLGLDRWRPAAFRRLQVRLVLLFFASCLPVLGAAGPAADAIGNHDSNALLLAVVGILVSLIGILVVLNGAHLKEAIWKKAR